jgi:nucleotide-binding universal stress UspA family protein
MGSPVFSARTILVPVTFDEVSGAALAHALDLAAGSGAGVHLLHVVELLGIVPPDALGLGAPELLAQTEEAAREALDQLVLEHAGRGVPLWSALRVGDAAREIVAVARSLPADLVVMGTHGRRGVAHALLGSVAEKVVRTSEVPVLTVHAHVPEPQSRPSHAA